MVSSTDSPAKALHIGCESENKSPMSVHSKHSPHNAMPSLLEDGYPAKELEAKHDVSTWIKDFEKSYLSKPDRTSALCLAM